MTNQVIYNLVKFENCKFNSEEKEIIVKEMVVQGWDKDEAFKRLDFWIEAFNKVPEGVYLRSTTDEDWMRSFMSALEDKGYGKDTVWVDDFRTTEDDKKMNWGGFHIYLNNLEDK